MECETRSFCFLLCVCFSSVFNVTGNLVLTPNGYYNAENEQLFTATLCHLSGQQPHFTLEYVSVSDSRSLFVINSSVNANANINLTLCQGNIYTYQYRTRYVDHPALIGHSVKLRVTTQSPSFSALSSGVIIFRALYSLFGSSSYATWGQDYTWTCDTSGEKPSGVDIMYICWYRGGYTSSQKVGCSYFRSGSCGTLDIIPPYSFNCTSQVFTLTIPGANMDESHQKTLWRCVNSYRTKTTTPNYTSPFQELSVACNLVLTPSGDYNAESGQSFVARLCHLSGQQPLFTLEYVSVSDSRTLYVIDSSVTGNSNVNLTICQGTIYSYLYKTRYIDHQGLTGQSVKLRVTTQSPSISALSSGVIIFRAVYRLNGSSTYATFGQNYTWTCDTSGVKPPGSPIMYICWYRGGYNSSQRVGCSYFHSGSCGTQDNIAPYSFDCESSTVYRLIIPGANMDESQHTSLWRCANNFRSISDNPNNTSPFKELFIAIPVVNVTLFPSSIDSIENVTRTIQCLPNSNARPQPTITWYKDNVDITNQATTDRKSITLSFMRSDNTKILRCTATGQSRSVNATATITVRFPPTSDPVITGYDGSTLHEGDGTITVACIQEGGNPVANMTFTCLGNGGTITESANVVSSSHTLTIDRSLDKQICICTTTHTVGNFQRTVNRQFTVYYPPQKPYIQLSTPYPWKSGDNSQITCVTSGGNPTLYNFTWVEGATIIHVGQQLNLSSLTSIDNGRQISCQVDNAFRGQPIRSDQTTLRVEYDPQINVDTSAVNVKVGKTFTRTCTAVGNPSPTVRWHREGGNWLTIPQPSSSTLTLKNVSWTDTGQYTCQATALSTGSNDLQPAKGSFNLTVVCAVSNAFPHEGDSHSIGLFFAGLFCGLGIAAVSNFIFFIVQRRRQGLTKANESTYDSVQPSSRDQNTYEGLRADKNTGPVTGSEYVDLNIADISQSDKSQFSSLNATRISTKDGFYANTALTET